MYVAITNLPIYIQETKTVPFIDTHFRYPLYNLLYDPNPRTATSTLLTTKKQYVSKACMDLYHDLGRLLSPLILNAGSAFN